MSELLYTPHFAPSLLKYVEQGEELASGLLGNVGGHNDPRDGFKPLPYNVVDYPYHRPDCIRITGTNASAEDLRNLASVVYPHFEQVIDAYKRRPDLLNHIYDTFDHGRNVATVTDHLSVIGVAVAGGALACALYEERLITPEELKTGIFVSSMIKHTKLLGSMPTVDVLAGIFTETFFSLPPSQSVRESGIPKEYRSDFNEATKNDADEVLNQYNKDELIQEKDEQSKNKPLLLMVAGSGSRDRLGTVWLKKRRIFMGPLANGTVDLLKKPYVLPVGLDIRNERPQTYIGRLRQPIKTEEQAHGIMAEIATGMSRGPRINRRYYRTRELLANAWAKTDEYQEEQRRTES
jgi:hypothetical protein